jgi:hypothetical protein
MQGLNGVPSLPSLFWLLRGKRVAAVIEAYIEGSPPMHCIVGTCLHPPRTVSNRKEAIERGTYRRLSPPQRLVQTEPRLMLYVQ